MPNISFKFTVIALCLQSYQDKELTLTKQFVYTSNTSHRKYLESHMFKAGQNYSLTLHRGLLSPATKRPEGPHADHKASKFQSAEAGLQNLSRAESEF